MKTEIDTFKHILVVLQADEDNMIPLARATRLCRAMSAKMTVFLSCQKRIKDTHQEDDLSLLVDELKNIVTVPLEKWDALSFLKDIRLSWQQKPSKAVELFIEKSDIDLILKAPYQQSEFKHLFRSGLDKYFVSNCRLPIWLVKPRLWDGSFEVLSCIDMGDDSYDNHILNRKILATSDKLASDLHAEMHVVDCFYGEVGTMRIDYDNKRGFKREATIEQQHIERLKLYVNEYALSDDVIHFVEGMPDHSIPDKAAEISAEVAVIGNNEDTNYIDKIFGDTAVELAKAMPCDLLILKPDQP